MESYYVIISACHSGHLAVNLLVVGFIREMSAGLIMAGSYSAETRTIKCPLGCGAAPSVCHYIAASSSSSSHMHLAGAKYRPVL